MKSSRNIAIVCALALATSAGAQRPKSAGQSVPPSLRPPAGMCRVWVDNVPPGRQPAPTDCASALRNRPSNGQVIFGDDYAGPDSQGTSLKGVAPLPKSMMEPKPADTAKAGKKVEDVKKKLEPRKPGGGLDDDSTASSGPGTPGRAA
jgi:hypothetical protein